MDWQQAVRRIVAQIESEPAVEGAFLGGSLATAGWDELSDIDIGIATADSPEDLARAYYALRAPLAATAGDPIHSLEREWDHSRMIALLYGKTQYPPLGLELDLFFGQLRYVEELMPGASLSVIFDRSGRLGHELTRLDQAETRHDIKRELEEQMNAFPFDLNHAARAQARGDLFNQQFVMERMRTAIYSAAASRSGRLVSGSKRVSRYLSASERETVERSCQDTSPQTIPDLADLYLALLAEAQAQYGIEEQVEHLRAVLPQVT